MPNINPNKPHNYAFIDSQNLNLSIQNLGWKLNFGRFRQYLAQKYNVSKAFIFIGNVEGNDDLYRHLESNGYQLIYKPTRTNQDGVTKGNVDAELVLHTMIEISNFDKAVIVSGDGDFYCLVEYLISRNKLAKLLIPDQKHYSSLLRTFDRDYIAFISSLDQKLKYIPKHKKPLASDSAATAISID